MRQATAAVVSAIALGCTGNGGGGPVLDGEGFRIETVAENLNVPWDIAFAPDGRLFFTERPGRVRVVQNGQLRAEPVHTFTDVVERAEMGLMGMAIHPNFGTNRWMYFAYGYRNDAVKVVRLREQNGSLIEPTTVIDNLPAAAFHAGCQLEFGPDGKLYISTGDATEPAIAQDLGSLGGKTLRLNDDGSVPADNPYAGQSGRRAEIFSYGHRNAQGIAFQLGSGLMFQAEHGPSGGDAPGGGDEINIVERAKNYGWPVIHHEQTQVGMESPLLEYTPAVAPGTCAFYNGNLLPQFRGNFFFAALAGQGLFRVVLNGRQVVSEARLVSGLGRIRAVAEGPDGAIYFSTSNQDGRGSPALTDDRILRIVPD